MSDSPRSIVASRVIGGVKGFFELLQIKIAAECSHRGLKSGMLTRKVFQVTQDLSLPTLAI